MMGVDQADCFKVARMLGKRAFASLAVAFIDMGRYITNKSEYLAYISSNNDTMTLANGDMLLPGLNRTLTGGILSVCTGMCYF